MIKKENLSEEKKAKIIEATKKMFIIQGKSGGFSDEYYLDFALNYLIPSIVVIDLKS